MNAVVDYMNIEQDAVEQGAAPAQQIDANLLNSVVRQKRDIKRAMDAEAAAHKQRITEYKKQIDAIDAVLLRVLNDNTLPTFRSIDAGTIGTTVSTKYNVGDRTKLEAWIRSTNDLSMFSNALAKSVVESYVKQHNALPPGVRAYVERKVTHNTTTTG